VILAIDPGNLQSAYVVMDSDLRPLEFKKAENEELLERIPRLLDRYEDLSLAIEMVASYGMPVGASVFETCVWIGRFWQACDVLPRKALVYRIDEKLTLCHDSRAKDANIRQALIDRFAYGMPNKGKGTKKEPGWFYGFSADVWQAYAVGVTCADMMEGRYKRSESQGAKRADI